MKRFILLVVLLLTGCGRAAGPPQPPTLHADDVCARCGMAVEDTRFAAALQTAEGESLVFDDPGDMFAWRQEHAERVVAAAWVMDFQRGEWLALDQATFLRDVRLQTPMGHKVVAVTDAASAEQVRAKHGGTSCTAAEASRWVLDRITRLSMKGAKP